VTEEPAEAERRLAAAAQAGDRAAFDQLILRHKQPLYRLVRRYVGDADDAYDILQDCFVAAWLALQRFDSRQAFAPWLRAIALNKCRDHARRRAARRGLSLLLGSERMPLTGEPSASSLQPEEPEESRLRRLDEAIGALPRFYKEPLLLTGFSGLTHEEAARQLETTTKAIEMRVRRARERLRRALGDLADPESGTADRKP